MFQDNTKNVLEYNPYLTVHQPWGSFVFLALAIVCCCVCQSATNTFFSFCAYCSSIGKLVPPQAQCFPKCSAKAIHN